MENQNDYKVGSLRSYITMGQLRKKHRIVLSAWVLKNKNLHQSMYTNAKEF